MSDEQAVVTSAWGWISVSTSRVSPVLTAQIVSGVDIRIVQRLLGYSTIAITEIYTHVSDDALRKSLERADILGCLAA